MTVARASRWGMAALLSAMCVAASAEALRAPSPLGGAAAVPGIVVKPVAVRADEFPPAAPGQFKVGFECTIRLAVPQTDSRRFPRYRCDLDREQTARLNRLPLARVGVYPSADGITTKIVVIVEKSAQTTLERPARLHAAFQLYRDTSDKQTAAVLADYVYADGLAPSF